MNSAWSPSLWRALLLGALLSSSGCVDDGPLQIEREGSAAFNPTQFDAGALPPPPQGASIRFGMTPFYSPKRQERMLVKMRAYLTEAVGVPVKTVVFKDYDACVRALEEGTLDVAQLSPFTFVNAKKRGVKMWPFATTVAQGTPTYSSYLVVRRDSPIRSLEDAKGKRLGFVDWWSTSGHLYPRFFLQERGFSVEKDFKTVFLGQHDRVLQALLDGEIDIAAVSSDTVVSAKVMGISGPVRILAKPGRIPYDALVTRADLDPALKRRVRAAFLKLSVHTARGQRVLEDYNLINGFMPIPPGHFHEVEERANALKAKPPARLMQRETQGGSDAGVRR